MGEWKGKWKLHIICGADADGLINNDSARIVQEAGWQGHLLVYLWGTT